jgi:NAD(P)-dependent dehydrogenase (short-subunit alcohol dehydrogenase family)
MEQKVMMVTGGGRGIGAQVALQAASKGYAVCVNYASNRAAADALVASISAAGGRALAVQADVAVDADVQRLFAAVDREFGRLDALVNNAGILAARARVDQADAARLARLFAVNVVGSFLCAREAVRRMSTRHGGRGGCIVNLSSGAARIGAAGDYVDYAATKGAIDTFTIGLAREVATEGIRVNAVRPGFVATDIHAAAAEPGRLENVKEGVPMKRIGTAAEVARAILWLASDEASYCTGTILDATGGR